MSPNKSKVVVVMPAYNAAKTLHMTYADLPRDMVDLVILVDDGSSDETAKIARQLGLELFVHNRNYGYGANQKTCYREALRAGADIVVMVHPDYQYDPTLLPEIVKPIQQGEADVVLGSRLMGAHPMQQGMPWWKYISNRFLTMAENAVFQSAAVGIPHGLSRLPAGSARIGQPGDELRQVHLRPGDHGATGQYQDAHHRGAGAHAVLRASVVGVLRGEFHLRRVDPVAAASLSSAPRRNPAPAAVREPATPLQRRRNQIADGLTGTLE